jgi:hypothetical protein
MATKKKRKKLYGAAAAAHAKKVRGGGSKRKRSSSKKKGSGKLSARVTRLEHKVAEHGRRIGHLEVFAKATRKKLGNIYGTSTRKRRAG